MAKTRALRRRIRSVESISQVTRTMEMVSTSKLKRAQDRVVGARPYAQALAAAIGDLMGPDLAERFPLLRQPAPPARGGPRRAASRRAAPDHLQPRAGGRVQREPHPRRARA